MALVISDCREKLSDDPPEIVAIKSSSELKDKKGRYAAIGAVDGSKEFSWVEGKPGPGIGESISITFRERVSIAELIITNGFGNIAYWAKNNRIKELTVSSDSNEKVELTLKNQHEPQAIKLDDFSAKQMTLTIRSIYKGNKFDDTALAEVEVTSSHLSAELVKKLPLRWPVGFWHGSHSITSEERSIWEWYDLLVRPDGTCRWAASIETGHPSGAGIRQKDCTWTTNGKKLIIDDANQFKGDPEFLELEKGTFLGFTKVALERQLSRRNWKKGQKKLPTEDDGAKGGQFSDEEADDDEEMPQMPEVPPCSGVDDPPDRHCE